MGSKRRASDSDSSSSDPSPKRRKSEKKSKHKHKDKKSSKDAKKQQKKLLKEAKALVAAQGPSAGPSGPQEVVSQSEVDPITADDYFIKNPEFTIWLREAKGLAFGDLTAEVSRSHFLDFVDAWNAAKLAARYYRGLAGPSMRRSNHAWGIKGGGSHLPAGGLGLAAAVQDEDEAQAAVRSVGRQAEAMDRKRWRADRKNDLDEMLPKATGREAMLEQKAARREAAKDRDASPDLARLPGGGDVMGGDDSFAAAKARQGRQQAWQQRKKTVQQSELERRQAVLRAAEDDKMAQFRALAAAGPITIPERQ